MLNYTVFCFWKGILTKISQKEIRTGSIGMQICPTVIQKTHPSKSTVLSPASDKAHFKVLPSFGIQHASSEDVAGDQTGSYNLQRLSPS